MGGGLLIVIMGLFTFGSRSETMAASVATQSSYSGIPALDWHPAEIDHTPIEPPDLAGFVICTQKSFTPSCADIRSDYSLESVILDLAVKTKFEEARAIAAISTTLPEDTRSRVLERIDSSAVRFYWECGRALNSVASLKLALRFSGSPEVADRIYRDLVLARKRTNAPTWKLCFENACFACAGNGEVWCRDCRGLGVLPCRRCTNGMVNELIPCELCKKRIFKCSFCTGSNREPCRHCFRGLASSKVPFLKNIFAYRDKNENKATFARDCEYCDSSGFTGCSHCARANRWCDYCGGKGGVLKRTRCNWCSGTGTGLCEACLGTQYNICLICYGKCGSDKIFPEDYRR